MNRLHRYDGLWIALLALAVYVALGQDTLYRADGHLILVKLREGVAEGIATHFAYTPGLWGFAWLLSPLDLPLHRVATAFSAVGVAIGVALTHAGLRALGRDRRDAAVITALTALCPPVLFFATVVELHGAFFAASQLAFFAAARLIARPTTGRAVALGLAIAVGYLLHATAPFLLGAFVPWLLVAAPCTLRRRATLAPIVAIGTAVGLVAATLWIRQVVPMNPLPTGFAALLEVTLPRLTTAHVTLWHEWLFPYLPLSLTVWVALAVPAHRARGLALLVAVAGYVVATNLLIGGTPRRECGAYLLPLAALAALLTRDALGRRAALALALLSAVLGAQRITSHDVKGPMYRSFIRDVAAATGDRRPYLLTLDLDEYAACLVTGADLPWYLVTETRLPPAQLDNVFAALPMVFDRQRAAGRVPVFSVSTERHFAAPVNGPSGERFLELLRERFELRSIGAGSFEGWAIERAK